MAGSTTNGRARATACCREASSLRLLKLPVEAEPRRERIESARLEASREIRGAISAVRLYGQAHGGNGRALTRADLEQLEKSEDRIEAKLSRARRGGAIPVHQAVPRG